jgi:hypothetical protein
LFLFLSNFIFLWTHVTFFFYINAVKKHAREESKFCKQRRRKH